MSPRFFQSINIPVDWQITRCYTWTTNHTIFSSHCIFCLSSLQCNFLHVLTNKTNQQVFSCCCQNVPITPLICIEILCLDAMNRPCFEFFLLINQVLVVFVQAWTWFFSDENSFFAFQTVWKLNTGHVVTSNHHLCKFCQISNKKLACLASVCLDVWTHLSLSLGNSSLSQNVLTGHNWVTFLLQKTLT